MSVIIYGLVMTTWPSFTGWNTLDPMYVLVSAGITIGRWLLAGILAIIALKMPHLGTWMFYAWISKPENLKKVETAIDVKEKGEYQSTDPIYSVKSKLLDSLKKSEFRFMYFAAIILNPLMVIFYFILTSNYKLGGSYFSAFAGVVFAITIIINLLMITVTAAFYCRKDPENLKNRILNELISWIYMLLLPIVFVSFIVGWVMYYDLIGDLPMELAPILITSHKVLYVIQSAIAVCLAVVLLKQKPNFDWKKNNDNAPKIKNPILQKLYKLSKFLIIMAIIGGIVIIYILAIELIMVDFAMAFCVISYYLVTLYLLAIFSALKLVTRKPKRHFRYKTRYWTLVKVSAIILIINFLPTIGTVTYTNNDLEKQFDAKFGKDWESKIPEADLARMNQVQYSMFDAYFGTEVPINAIYENVYMQDHPRFVKNRTGDIVSNGSSKFTNVTHNMIYDAYLPASEEFDVTFNDSKDVKFPVIIYLHGVGMDRGTGNANWTSQYLANLGYLVCDMSYGFTGWSNYPYTGGKERGYDFPDTVKQIGYFTKFLENHSEELHADISKIYVGGRSFGGWMALNVAWLANTTFAGGNYSANAVVKGVFPYYGAQDLPGLGSELFELGGSIGIMDVGAPYIRGSSNPEEPDYNPEWIWYDPMRMAKNDLSPAGSLPPCFAFQGTHDYLVPQGGSIRLGEVCEENGHLFIGGFYTFGSHGFDALHWSAYGQSILYYMPRFIALTIND
jgi:acetyl esterase/lipase